MGGRQELRLSHVLSRDTITDVTLFVDTIDLTAGTKLTNNFTNKLKDNITAYGLKTSTYKKKVDLPKWSTPRGGKQLKVLGGQPFQRWNMYGKRSH